LLDNPDLTAVRLIRQLLGACRKLRLDCGLPDTRKSVEEFFQIDQECETDHDWSDPTALEEAILAEPPQWRPVMVAPQAQHMSLATPSWADVSSHVAQAADWITATLGPFDPQEWKHRHGPGAVSDLRFGSFKYEFKTWGRTLSSYFPYDVHGCYSWGALGEEGGLVEETDFRSSLACVPKTLKGPRLIAAEPVSAQWCQQAIKDYFYKNVARTRLAQFITFDDQSGNQRAALRGSCLADNWTIDLSSASDRVSLYHVERLFRRNPRLLACLAATRSPTMRQRIHSGLPEELFLRKYSTMGNATIFPVQSLFFLAVVLGCVSYTRRVPVHRLVRQLSQGEVRVFGDDIVVPADSGRVVMDALQHLRLKVNVAKTFGGSNFRESCGVDAFAGTDVTCASVLELPERTNPGSIVSSVDTSNNFFEKGLEAAAGYLREAVERACGFPFMRVAAGSGSFGFFSHDGASAPGAKSRWNPGLHRREYLVAATHVVAARRKPDTTAGLLQFFTELGPKVTSAHSSAGYLSSRPKVTVRLRWAPLGQVRTT